MEPRLAGHRGPRRNRRRAPRPRGRSPRRPLARARSRGRRAPGGPAARLADAGRRRHVRDRVRAPARAVRRRSRCARDLRGVVRHARHRPRDRPRPAAAPRCPDAARYPGRAGLRRQRPQPARRRRMDRGAARRDRHPGRPVPAVDPVRGGRVRHGRRQAARGDRPHARLHARHRGRAQRVAARGRGPRGPARCPPDRAALLRSVRAVPDHRRAVGRADPAARLTQDDRAGIRATARFLDSVGTMRRSRCRSGIVLTPDRR